MTINSLVTFHRVQLRMVSGEAAWVESKQSQAAREQTKLLPVPDAAAQEQHSKLVRQTFKDKYDAAKTPSRQTALAEELFQKAQRTADDPAEQYALLKEAGSLAVKAGNAELALQIIDEMDLTFAIDAYKLKVGALLATAKARTSSPPSQLFVDGILSLADEALAKDQFDTAEHLENLALIAVRRSKDAAWKKQFAGQKKEIDKELKELQKLHAETEDAEAGLQRNPVDADANATLGKYRCFVKGQWGKGVPMLALGSDSALKNIAEKELKGVRDVNAQAAVGNDWWQLAEREDERTRKSIREHAADWYRRALPGLTGTEKDSVEKKLRAMAAEASPLGNRCIDILPRVDLDRDRVSGNG